MKQLLRSLKCYYLTQRNPTIYLAVSIVLISLLPSCLNPGKGADDVMYSLYWSRLPETDEGACTLASDNTSLRENPNCLFWSACGIGNAADGHTDWVTLEANTGHVFEVRCNKTRWLVLDSSQVSTCAAFPLARAYVQTSIWVRSWFATKPRNNCRMQVI